LKRYMQNGLSIYLPNQVRKTTFLASPCLCHILFIVQ